MAFSSVPNSYNLDHHPHHPLSNWHQVQQQSNHQQVGQNSQLPPPPPPPVSSTGGSGEGSIRPGSMVDRARLARLPLPEAGINCPRCDSTNTKFCYFNNYSLTQPRHFCKTCRRYWTRGGALRSVPVGGGCRRNKRTKNRTSKSPITGDRAATNPNNTNSLSEQSPSSCSSEMTNHFSAQVPLMTALQNLGHYAAGNYGGFQAHMMGAGAVSGQQDMGFQLGNGSSGGGGDQGWRLPILAGFEQPGSNLFAYQGGEGIEQLAGQVKIEENRIGLNSLSRQLLSGGSENNATTNQYWGGNNSWMSTDFSSAQINVSSANHFL